MWQEKGARGGALDQRQLDHPTTAALPLEPDINKPIAKRRGYWVAYGHCTYREMPLYYIKQCLVLGHPDIHRSGMMIWSLEAKEEKIKAGKVKSTKGKPFNPLNPEYRKGCGRTLCI